MGRRRCRVPKARACTLPSRKSHSCRNLEPGVAANARPEAHGFGCPSPLILVLVVLALCSGAQLHAQAQAFNASLTGAVYDHSGAAVAGATVTLSNANKGIARTFTTGPDGHYTFTLVPAGTYTLKVEMTSFRPYTQNGIVLAVGQVAEQNVTLELGAVTQEITVTASAPLINTSNANISSDVDQRQTVTRLGEGLAAAGALGEAPMARTLAVVGDYVTRAERLAATRVRVVATSAVREAANGGAFVAAVERATGQRIEVVSGEEEARLVLRGVQSGLPATVYAAPVTVCSVPGSTVANCPAS